jgi:hypothetical protein
MAGLNKSTMFAEGIKAVTNGSVDWDTDVIKAVLMKESFANTTLTDTNRDQFNALNDLPAADRADPEFATVTADIGISSVSDNVRYGDGTSTIEFATVSSGNVCRGIVVFMSSVGGAASDCPVLCYNHFTAAVTADGGKVQVTMAAQGIFRVSYD